MRAPLTRDQQIAFMDRAKERNDARVARWKNDSVVKEVLSTPPKKKNSTKVTSTRSETVAACG